MLTMCCGKGRSGVFQVGFLVCFGNWNKLTLCFWTSLWLLLFFSKVSYSLQELEKFRAEFQEQLPSAALL